MTKSSAPSTGWARRGSGSARASTSGRRCPAEPPSPPPSAGVGTVVARGPASRSRSLDPRAGPANQYDAIVVGGGHNGLVAAAYLAKAGKRVVVLERRSVVGGAAVTEQPWGPAVQGHDALVRREPAAAVVAARSGSRPARLSRVPAGPVLRPLSRRPVASAARAIERGAAARSRSSRARDADAMDQWDAWLEGLAAVLGPLLSAVPPAGGQPAARVTSCRRPRSRGGCAGSASAAPLTSPGCSR